MFLIVSRNFHERGVAISTPFLRRGDCGLRADKKKFRHPIFWLSNIPKVPILVDRFLFGSSIFEVEVPSNAALFDFLVWLSYLHQQDKAVSLGAHFPGPFLRLSLLRPACAVLLKTVFACYNRGADLRSASARGGGLDPPWYPDPPGSQPSRLPSSSRIELTVSRSY